MRSGAAAADRKQGAVALGIFDLVTVAVGTIGYLIGRSRGLVWQLSGIATLVVGGLSATVLARPLGAKLGAGPLLGPFAAWVIVYAVVAVCLYVLSLRLKHRIEELEFDELDKRFGGALGAFKGLAVFAVVTLIAVALSARVEAAVKGSASGQALRAIVHELRPLLPERVHEAFGPYLDPVTDPEPAPQPTAPAEPAPPAPKPDPGPARPVASGAAGAATPPAPQPVNEPLPPLEYPEVPLPAGPTPAAPAEPDDPFDTSNDPPDPLAPPPR